MDTTKTEEEIISTMTSTSNYSHFYYIYINENRAKCKMCAKFYQYDNVKTGTKSLKRHLIDKHSNVALAKEEHKSLNNESSNSKTLDNYWNKDSSKKRRVEPDIKTCIITLCCAKHVHPLNYFEDKVVTKGFGLPYIDGDQVKMEIKMTAARMKRTFFEEKFGQWASIALDGWKNPVTQQKHLNIILFFLDNPTKPVFLRSFVIESNHANVISNKVINVLEELDKFEIVVVGGVTDNAPCMISAMDIVFEKRPTVMPLRCSSHILNLVIKDSLASVKFLAKSLDILNSYIQQNKIKRYCITRWNSIYDRFKDLSNYMKKEYSKAVLEPQNTNSDDVKLLADNLDLIENSIIALTPFIDVLNKSQQDGTGWPKIYSEYCNAIEKTSERGLDKISDIAENRKKWIKNPIVCLDLYLNKIEEIDDNAVEKLYKWMGALKIEDFKKYTADREFNPNSIPSRRLKLFHEEKLKCISISEAAVERCFSIHKLIHSPLRAKLTDDIVEDILFIRYNYEIIENIELDEKEINEIEKLEPLN